MMEEVTELFRFLRIWRTPFPTGARKKAKTTSLTLRLHMHILRNAHDGGAADLSRVETSAKWARGM